MPISIREACSAGDISLVFELRKQVFIDEEDRFEKGASIIFDVHDTFSETRNFLALIDGVAIGAIRVTLHNKVGSPAQAHYDFAGFLERQGIDPREVATIGWLCISKKYRRHSGLFMGLLKMVTWYARRNGASHIVAPMHPGAVPIVKHIGGQAIGPEQLSPVLGVPIVPMYANHAALPPGVRETLDIPDQLLVDHAMERRIYQRGELINRKGELGDEAFIVMRGAARSVQLDPGVGQEFSPALLEGELAETEFLYGPGELFGELSLLDGGPRTVTIVGHSREVDAMVLTRDHFLNEMRGSSEKAMWLARLLGKRMRIALNEIPPVQPSVKLLALVLYDASREGREPVNVHWLATQTGTRVKNIKAALGNWEKYLRIESDEEIYITDKESLRWIASGGSKGEN